MPSFKPVAFIRRQPQAWVQHCVAGSLSQPRQDFVSSVFPTALGCVEGAAGIRAAEPLSPPLGELG